ncbi:MAG: tetratricopeptide repeat protein [Bacteroidales bacterium]|nr:tetratricopeptide repeat protein [Bacteroidales bacterium]
MKRVVLILLNIMLVYSLFAQEGKLSSSNWEMTKAKMFFEDNQIQEALDVYFELYSEHPQNDLLNVRIAECYFRLFEYEKSLDYLDAALNSNPQTEYISDINYWYGQCYHKIGSFDKAIDYYSKLTSTTEQFGSNLVANCISQSKTGKELLKTKYDCSFTNLGENVNSEFNEIFPVYSWYANKMYFTSDRYVFENQEQNPITKLYKYSVLESYLDTTESFLAAELIDEVFSKAKDYILTSVGLNDNDYILYRHTPENEDGGEIYILHLDDESDFSEPKNIGTTVNTMKYEGAGSLDFVNNELFFVTNTNNKKSVESDVFYSLYKRGNFSNTLVVKECNSNFDEKFVYIHPGGDFLVFASNNAKSMGGYDLFICIKDGKAWTEPVNMGIPFNSAENETSFTLSPDAKYAYITSDRPGGYGRLDIYRVDFEKYFEKRFGFSPALTVVRGQVTNDEGADIVCEINIQGVQKDCFSQKIDTDKEGNFSFVLKPNNNYQIEVKQKPYQNYIREINLTENLKSNIELEIELETK